MGVITIADKRSARNDTLIQFYKHYNPNLKFLGFGILPRETREHDAWIDF